MTYDLQPDYTWSNCVNQGLDHLLMCWFWRDIQGFDLRITAANSQWGATVCFAWVISCRLFGLRGSIAVTCAICLQCSGLAVIFQIGIYWRSSSTMFYSVLHPSLVPRRRHKMKAQRIQGPFTLCCRLLSVYPSQASLPFIPLCLFCVGCVCSISCRGQCWALKCQHKKTLRLSRRLFDFKFMYLLLWLCIRVRLLRGL